MEYVRSLNTYRKYRVSPGKIYVVHNPVIRKSEFYYNLDAAELYLVRNPGSYCTEWAVDLSEIY